MELIISILGGKLWTTKQHSPKMSKNEFAMTVSTENYQKDTQLFTWVSSPGCLSWVIPSRISMLLRASPHTLSPAPPDIESTATAKLVSLKCGWCCGKKELRLSSTLSTAVHYSVRPRLESESSGCCCRRSSSSLRSCARSVWWAPPTGWYY